MHVSTVHGDLDPKRRHRSLMRLPPAPLSLRRSRAIDITRLGGTARPHSSCSDTFGGRSTWTLHVLSTAIVKDAMDSRRAPAW